MTQFDSNPLTDKEQAKFRELTGSTEKQSCPDWAEALTEARVALRTLDDAFPGQDMEQVQQAHKRLTQAAQNVRMFMILKGVEPLV